MSEEEDNEAIFIRVDLGPQNGELNFRSIEDAQDWITSEVEYWAWINNIKPVETQDKQNLSFLNNQQFKPLSLLNQSLTELISRKGSSTYEPWVHKFRARFESLYSTHRYLCSATPAAKFIKKLSDDEPLIAAYVLAQFTDNKPFVNTNALHEGIFRALAYKHGFSDSVIDEKQALNDLRDNWKEEEEKFKDELFNLRNAFQDSQQQVYEFHEKGKEDFDNLIKESENNLREIERTYDKKLSLQSAVNYWTARAKGHRILASVFAVAAIISAIILINILEPQIELLLKPIISQNDALSSEVELWRLGVLVVYITIGFWILRILIRIMFSHIHLGTDAGERKTMILTYLALLREGEGIKDEDRQLILQILFRPSTTGIVKDDAIPPTLIDLLTRHGSAQR